MKAPGGVRVVTSAAGTQGEYDALTLVLAVRLLVADGEAREAVRVALGGEEMLCEGAREAVAATLAEELRLPLADCDAVREGAAMSETLGLRREADALGEALALALALVLALTET